MLESRDGLIERVRARFAHVDECPFQGPRVFFENAGGALTLKSVVDTSARFAAIPDNQGRDNVASAALMRTIDTGREDARAFLNARSGQIIVGESGTELLFRMIRSAVLASGKGKCVVGSTLEHPASRSAAARWADVAGVTHELAQHDNATGTVTLADYEPLLGPDLGVVTIIHTSPVTGMGVDVAAIAARVRECSPECFIIVDGIQHAAHGHVDIDSYDIDAYAISPYKAFSRHGYGLGWLSDRLARAPHDRLIDSPDTQWEFGTRDTGAYATFSDVVDYLDWLGGEVSQAAPTGSPTGSPSGESRRERIEAAAAAIHAHEQSLTELMLHGSGNLAGLARLPGVSIIGGIDNPQREGLVAFSVPGLAAATIVARLGERGIRVHIRKDDHYSGNVLKPLELDACVRVSLCHYNTSEEVIRFLDAMRDIVSAA